MKILFVCLIISCIFVPNVYAQDESFFSPSLARMEREWFNKEFNNEADDVRISRLEEKVFGTIHDVDKNIRYHQLQKAFDAKKMMQAQNKRNHLYGTPTSIPVNIDDLVR